MSVRLLVLILSGFLFSASLLPTGGQAKKDRFATRVAPLIAKYCAPCHAGATPAGKAPLVSFKTESQVRRNAELWDKALRRLANRQMPPVGAPQLSAAQRKSIVTYLQGLGGGKKDPGRVTMRRLNRAEYDNTIRDLVGIDIEAANDFPSDDVGNGFDNIGDVLSISPLLMEKYLDAAEKVVAKAILVPEPRVARYDPAALSSEGGVAERAGELAFYSRGTASVAHRFARPGTYRIKILAWAQQAGPDVARMSLSLDNAAVATFEVRGTRGSPGLYEADVEAAAGVRTVSVAFVNDYYRPDEPNPQNRDRNLYVQRVEIVAPLGSITLPASQRRIIFIQPKAGKERDAARQILARFARRAYRRPPAQSEVDSLLRVFDLASREKEPFERGIQLAVQAALSSPYFIFKVEKGTPTANRQSPIQSLTSHEVASRLSYFLWSSMPDDELFARADENALQQAAALEAQIKRMLRDPKAKALADNFAAQWLQLRKLDNVNPDPAKFSFSDDLRRAMKQETLLFFRNVVAKDLSVLEFINGDYTFLNATLARHYGIAGVEGDQFRMVKLEGQREGVLTQASILTVTSNPTRTSPVKRGKWILENFLNDPPPPPPPGADNLGNDPRKLEGKTLRTIMSSHRINPSCANCHDRMDTLGLGLENFDAIGRWRNQYTDGLKIDAGGKLPNGRTFETPRQLISLLAADREKFVRAFTERLFTYALGRGLTVSDNQTVRDIVAFSGRNGYRFSSIVTGIVLSDSFRKRRN